MRRACRLLTPPVARWADIIPRHRFMSAYEQHIEPPDRDNQYLLFAAEPYETIAFKLQAREVDKGSGFFSYWDPDQKQFTFQFFYKNTDDVRTNPMPLHPPAGMPTFQAA